MLKRIPKSPAAIQLTSFIDVVFNLLAFVLLVGSLESETPQSLGVEIPRVPAVAMTSKKESSTLVLKMASSGAIFCEDREISEDKLPEILRQLQTSETTTELWADRRLSYERVVRILAVVRENGGRHVKLMVLPEGQ